MKHRLILYVALVLPTLAQAGWLGNATRIDRIRLFDGYALVQTNGPITKARCANTDKAFVLLLENNNYGHRKFEMLMAAHTTGRVFNPWCENVCQKWDNVDVTVCTEASIE